MCGVLGRMWGCVVLGRGQRQYVGAGVYKPSGAPGKFGKPALGFRVAPAKPEILDCFRQLVRACGRSPQGPSPSCPESPGLPGLPFSGLVYG